MGDVLVERLVFVLGNLAAGAGPKRSGLVDRFQGACCALIGVVPGRLLGHAHRRGDVVGILAHQIAQAEGVGELQRIVPQMQDHPGAAPSFGVLHAELVLPCGAPAKALVGPVGTGQHRHFLGDDEGAVEPHSELTDEAGILLLIAGQLREELGGAGLGDGA